jgi:hypothetical protein
MDVALVVGGRCSTFFAIGDMVVVVVVHKGGSGGERPPITNITNTNI